jgi:4-hydroxybenzoate polyprenyltransferase
MYIVIRSSRFYFWPIIAANVVSVTLAVGGDLPRGLGFSIAISCLASFGFLLNDLWDRDVDRINRKKHLEHSDAATLKGALAVGVGFLIAGLVLAFCLGSLEFNIACGIALALAAYTVLLRRFLFIPTIVAALLAASPVWAPLVIWGNKFDMWKCLFLAAIIVILAAREILMDAGDRVGDLAGGRETFATVFGTRIAKGVSVILTLSAVVPFVVAIACSAFNFSLAGKLAVIGIGGLIAFLLVHSVLKMLLETQDDETAIPKYMNRSRAAMALIPLLNLLLWRV